MYVCIFIHIIYMYIYIHVMLSLRRVFLCSRLDVNNSDYSQPFSLIFGFL